MPIINSRLAATAAAILLAGTVAQAATLSSIQGAVLVNTGQGYKPAQSTLTLSAGDAVMVEPGSTASVTYSDGCQVQVQAGGVLVIGPQSPCALRPKQGYMGLAGGGNDQGSPWTNWFSLEALELGGLVVAGAGAAAWALTGNHHASDPTGLNSGGLNSGGLNSGNLNPASP